MNDENDNVKHISNETNVNLIGYATRPVSEIKDKWQLLPAYVRAKGFIRQHIDSYAHFVLVEMAQIVTSNNCRLIKSNYDPKFFLEFTDCRVGKPSMINLGRNFQLTPIQCRQSDLTYSAPIYVNLEYYCGNRIVRRINEEIGRVPVMLKSPTCWMWKMSDEKIIELGECPLDPGGYFIIKGSEKAILMQEQLSKNRIIVELDYKKNYCATVSSVTHESKSRTQVVYYNKRFYMRHNSFTEDIPIVIILKAMNMENDQQIAQNIELTEDVLELFYRSFHDTIQLRIRTQQEALQYVADHIRAKSWIENETAKSNENLKQAAHEVLSKIILSHIEVCNYNYTQKTTYICLMIKRLISAINNESPLDDKDYYGNKRLELAGQLLALQFEDKFRTWRDEFRRRIDETLKRHFAKKTAGDKSIIDSYPDIIRDKPLDTITRGLQQAISTGNWNIRRFRMEKSGVSQVLSRFSYVGTLGMMTRLVAGIEKGMKLAKPRWLQPSQWGVICPCDTPEGESIGLVKNLSLMAHVTTDENDEPLKKLAYHFGLEDLSTLNGEEFSRKGTCKVMLNGILLGIHNSPEKLIKNWRKLRRTGKIGQFISIYLDEAKRCVFISSDGGRLCRPLVIVDNGIPCLTQEHIEQVKNKQLGFFDLIKQGIIEWIDVNEQNNAVIALKELNITNQTTHLEIDPLTIMGIVSGLIPYPHHNQSPRNTYQCAMGKQAMGIMAYNQFNRTDNVLYSLVYPQKQLCKTRTIELANLDKLPAGHSAVVAITSYSAYDIEDALILNKASLDRGFGSCIVLKRFSVELKNYGGYSDKTLAVNEGKSDSLMGGVLRKKPDYRYEVLENDGVARVGASISQDQIYLNKAIPIPSYGSYYNSDNKFSYQLQPVKYKTQNPSYIERIILTENSEENTVYKFIFRQTRRPEYGDKFSSRHGQKGVIGCIAEPEDMPFTEDGIIPDMIMNPHGFPSRMTVGKMLELIAGKSTLFDGKLKYGTAFAGTKIEDIAKILCGSGYHYSGKDYLTNGCTGEALETYIFNGPIFYQKLKHMVEDKIHARGIGPRQLLTRQPTEGRAKMGGLRMGEMERDCLVAYGAVDMLYERLILSSDAFNVEICSRCGLFGYNAYCGFCNSSDNMATIKIPYACKLLFQELIAMNVTPRIKVSSYNNI